MLQRISAIGFALFFSIICFPKTSKGGDTLRTLFVGNSYTYYNNMPQIVASLASASGDHLIFSSSAPGGYTLKQHSTNSTTTALINQGNWDFVVLQGQSQLPSFPDAQVQADVFPYAQALDNMIKSADSCTKTVFYMTWGRKNGDANNCAFFPPLCTYEGMDSLLQLRYTMMADSNNAVLSPVAKVWRNLRNNHPGIELYDADESHPSLKGSYAIAVSFYTLLFKKNPLGNTYSGGLSSSEATIIQQTVKDVVFDSLNLWYSFYPSVQAAFSFSQNGNTLSFQNTSLHGSRFQWLFGDGDTSSAQHPTHTYTSSGNYNVKLITSRCHDHDTAVQQINVSSTGIETSGENDRHVRLFPNPAKSTVRISASLPVHEIQVYDVAGRLLQNWMPQSNELIFSVAGFAPGIYLIKIKAGNKFIRQRLVIE